MENTTSATPPQTAAAPGSEDGDLRYAVDAVFRAAHGAKLGLEGKQSLMGCAIALQQYAEELQSRGWVWTPGEAPYAHKQSLQNKD